MIKVDEEFKNLIPPLTNEEYSQLEKNIVKEGIRDPLVVWHVPSGDNILLDGHNRWEIAAHHGGIKFETVQMSFENRAEAKEWIIKNQLGRRNIPLYVRAELALLLKPEIEKKARQRMSEGAKGTQISAEAKGETRDQVAKAAGVSHDTIHKVEKIQEKASEETKQALRNGETSINAVYSGIMAAEHEDKRKQADRELREAKQRVEEYQSEDSEVIDFGAAVQNKEDEKMIFDDFNSKFTNLIQHIRSLGSMASDGRLEKVLYGANKYDLRQTADRLAECLRIIMKVQRVTTEAIENEK